MKPGNPGRQEGHAPIQSLPAELLIEILKCIRLASTSGAFTNTLLVCREWRAAATPLLWTNIFLTNQTLVRFVRSLGFAQQAACESVKNLTLSLNPCPDRQYFDRNKSLPDEVFGMPMKEMGIEWDFPRGPPWRLQRSLDEMQGNKTHDLLEPLHFPGWEQQPYAKGNTFAESDLMWLCLLKLANLMKEKLKRIVVFSFRMSYEGAGPATQWRFHGISGGRVPSKILQRMLEALPPSCVSLELDDCGITRDIQLNTTEICPILRTLLSRLQHLRLRIHEDYRALVEDIAPSSGNSNEQALVARNLKTLAINMRPWPGFVFRDVTSIKRKEYIRKQNLLVTALEKSQDAGAFPCIEHLTVVNIHNQYPELQDKEHSSVTHFTRVDLLRKTTQIFPVGQVIGTGRDDYARTHRGYATYLYPGNSAEPQFGSVVTAEEIVDNSWITTTTGLRFPASLRDARGILKDGVEWREPAKDLEDETAYRERLRELLLARDGKTYQEGIRSVSVDVDALMVRRVPERHRAIFKDGIYEEKFENDGETKG